MKKTINAILILMLIILLSINASANWVSFANGGFEDGNLGSGSAGNWTATQPTKLITSTTNSHSGSKNAHDIDATNDAGDLRWIEPMPANSISMTNHWHLKWFIASDSPATYGLFKTPSGDCFIYGPNVAVDDINTNGVYVERTGFCTKTDAVQVWHFVLKSGGATGNVHIDDVQYWQFEDINIQNLSPTQGTKDVNFTLKVKIVGKDTGSFGTSPDTNTYVNFDNAGYVQMDFNSTDQTYRRTFSVGTAGTYTYDLNAVQTSFNDTTATLLNESIDIFSNPASFLTFTPVENISTFAFGSVDITPSNENNQLIWRIDSNSGSVETVLFNIFNSLNNGKQYSIYTADLNNYLIDNFTFQDSLTFGSTSTSPIQKIWNGTKYVYSFGDSINPLETKFYKLTYENPYKSFNSIYGSSEWVNGLAPQQIDGNGFPIDSFQISAYSNIRSYYNEPIPQITGGTGLSFEFQFTAWSDSPASLSIGTTKNELDTIIESFTLTATPHTYSVSINSSDFEDLMLFKTFNSSPSHVYVYNWTIVPRKYFTKRLTLLKADGDDLDNILINNISTPYLQEGISFKITSQAYDRTGQLNRLDLIGYFDSNADSNKVSRSVKVLTSETEKLFNFTESFSGITDLIGNANTPFRILFVKAFLFDNNGLIVAEQSKQVKFIQFPYFSDDLKINFFPTEKRTGKKPKGVLTFNIKDSNILNGFDIRIFNSGSSINSPEYTKRIYKGKDFNCSSNTDCSMNLTISDFIYEDANYVNFAITSLINTENFSLTNALIQSLRTFLLSSNNFDTEKIYQVNERTDFTYRPDEEIPVVLVLRDSEAGNIHNKINVFINLDNCDAPTGGNCTTQTTQFSPSGFLFDPQFNYNYYFFRSFWVLDNGNSLPDGNYIRFKASITDKTSVTTPSVAVLTSKCFDGNYSGDFFGGALASILQFGLGCTQQQFGIVTTNTNSTQEKRIKIDLNRNTTAPTQELFACLSPDSNNIIGNPLKQDFVCFSWYKVAEQPIDDFRLRIGNQFSDYSNTGSTKQYSEYNIPYELISYNDVALLKNQLEVNQNTSIDTLGEFFFAGLNQVANLNLRIYGINNIADFLGKNGLITNIGADANFNNLFEPTTVSGAMFYRIKGLPIINAQDFKTNSKVSPSFDSINKTQFLEFLAVNNVSFPKTPSTLELVINDFTIPVKITDTGHIVIDEVSPDNSVNNQNLDQNSQQKFNIPPNILFLTLQHTMFFNSFTGNDSLALTLKILFQVRDNAGTIIGKFIGDPAGTTGSLIFNNIIFIAIGLGILVVFAFIISGLRKGGGNTIVVQKWLMMFTPYLIIIVLALMAGLAFPLPIVGNIGSFVFNPLLSAFGVFGIFITFNMLFVLSIVISLVYFSKFLLGGN